MLGGGLVIGFWGLLFVGALVLLVAACSGDAGGTIAFTPPPRANVLVAAPPVGLCAEGDYCDLFDVGGRLTAAAWLDDSRMYLADFEGRIRLLNLETREVTTLLTGLSVPQGLTVLDGRLYVSDMGNVCRLIEEVSGDEYDNGCRSYPDGTQGLFYNRVNAQILSYRIGDSGALDDEQIAVDRIISFERDHSPNGLTNDGDYVYASIGNPQLRVGPQEGMELAEYGLRTELMGTIARFRPPGNEVEVYATGFRNVYGISIAPDGTIYGADNDEKNWLVTEGHLEELNAIVKDGFYGFPVWGTNEAPPEANVTEPVAVLRGTGSTFAYANQDGVYVAYLALGGDDNGFVVDRFDYESWTPERIFRDRGYITAILEGDGLLYVVSFLGIVHVINPAVAPVQGSPAGVSADSPGYDVYIHDNRLTYIKNPCSQADADTSFYLHVVPVNLDDLPEDRKRYGFDNLDFRDGWKMGDSCRVMRELPEYDISVIKTGQFVQEGTGFRHTWEAEHRFR